MNSRKLTKALETERAYRDGDVVFSEGDHGTEMFVIRKGAVRITKRGSHELATLDRGDFFGEMAVLASLPRDATATAVGDTKLLVIGTGGLLLRLRQDPSFGVEMLQRMTDRVRQLNDIVTKLRIA